MQKNNVLPFIEALASTNNLLENTFEAMSTFADNLVGHRLFTLTKIDRENGSARRIYSNMPEAYPVSGTKPANVSDWSRQVIDEHRTFVANDIASIAEVFNDYELICSLGCESIINVPVVICSRVIGTINCLCSANHYTPERVSASEELKLPGVVCFLSHQLYSNNGDK